MASLTRKNQVKHQISKFISQNNLQLNAYLPSVRSLAKTLGTSTNTVQEAINTLKQEGLLDSRPGKGVFVKAIMSGSSDTKRIGLLHLNKTEYLDVGPYPKRPIAGLRAALEESGYELFPIALESIDMLFLSDAIAEQKLSGLVLFEIDSSLVIHELLALRLPMVSMDYDLTRFGIPSVCFDNHLAMIELTKHFIELGHKDVLFICPPPVRRMGMPYMLDVTTEERREGYRIAMRLASLNERVLRMKKDSLIGEHLRDFTGSHQLPSAIICSSLNIAKKIISELQDNTLLIPDDFCLGTFGNLRMDSNAHGRFYSTLVDYEALGDMTSKFIMKALKNNGSDPEKCTLSAKLIECHNDISVK